MAKRRKSTDKLLVLLGTYYCIVNAAKQDSNRQSAGSSVASDPSYAELDDYNLYAYTDSSYSDTDLAGNIFSKDDIQYHNYYTWTVESRDQSRKCTKHDFICPSYKGMYGHCLERKNGKIKLLCDGSCDCMNCADETLCDEVEKVRGVLFENDNSNAYSCDGVQIPAQWRCDGYVDCASGVDETENNCGSTFKYCKSSKTRCNGVVDCLDRSDEKNCGQITETRADPNGKSKRKTWYKCADFNKTQQYYHYKFRCDGKLDCSDGSDEPYDKCGKYSYGYDQAARQCASVHNGLYCKQSENQPFICLKVKNVCGHRGRDIQCHDMSTNRTKSNPYRLVSIDKHPTCTDNSVFKCKWDEYRCTNEGINTCLPASKLCDGTIDCVKVNQTASNLWDKGLALLKNDREGTDEDEKFCRVSKNCDQSTCPKSSSVDLNCKKWKTMAVTETGMCSDCRCVECATGFAPVKEGTYDAIQQKKVTCKDIDECQINHYGTKHHPCSHGCVNTLGSYHCHCPAGLVLSLDGHTCRPITPSKYPVYFYVTQKNKVTQLEVQHGIHKRWEPISENTIFERTGVTFTAIAIDENNMEVDTGKEALVYFGSYNRDKNEDEPGKVGASIYRYSQKTGHTERFYQFTSGKIEGLAFDFITGTLHVTLTNYTHPKPCKSVMKDYVSGAHVLFPTYATSDQHSKVPFFATHVNLTKPRAIMTAPAHASTYIIDWKNSKKRSYLYAIKHATWENAGSKATEVGPFEVKTRTLPMYYANSLVHDKFNHRILILDGKEDNTDDTIISCTYNLTICRYIFKHSARHFYGAALVGKELFFVEMKKPEIIRVDIFDPTNVSVFKRFDSQTYNMAVQNYEYQSKSSAAQNFEVCKLTKQCDYLCITTTLEGHAKATNNKFNHTNFGIMGASCQCPDGSLVNSTQSCSMDSSIDKDGNHVIKEVGIVLSNKNRYSQLTIFDVGPGRSGRIPIDISDTIKGHFNESNFYHGEFYDPTSQKLFKWRSDEGAVHYMDLKDMMACDSTTVRDLKNIRFQYGMYDGVWTAPNASYLYDKSWIAYGRWKAKMTFRKPIVVAELGIVCGYTYREEVNSQSNYPTSAYILLCMRTGTSNFAVQTKKATPVVLLESTGIFGAGKYGLVNYENKQLMFRDWYNLTNVWHTEDMSNFTKNYNSISRIWEYDSKSVKAYISTYDELFAYEWSSMGSPGSYSLMLNMTERVNKTTSWCDGKIMSSGFDSVTKLGKRLHGRWKAYCYKPYSSSSTSYSWYSSQYRAIHILFSCTLETFATTQGDCNLVHVSDRLKMTATWTDDLSWVVFLDLNSKTSDIKQTTCPNELSACTTFCAPNPYTEKLHCVCPAEHAWDSDTKKCESTKVYSWHMRCTDTNGKIKYLNETDVCNGVEDCADKSDELGCSTNCNVGQFRCSGKGSKMSKCVEWKNVCDGNDDCSSDTSNGNSADEDPAFCKKTKDDCIAEKKYFCSTDQTSQWSFTPTSASRGYCMPWNIVADGWQDCYGGSTTQGKTNYWDENYNGKKQKCDYLGGVFCKTSQKCITNKQQLCDGVNNCGHYYSSYSSKVYPDRTDEKLALCKNITQKSDYWCDRNSKFFCKTSKQCIDLEKKCNGHSDCHEGEDEMDCPTNHTNYHKLYHHPRPTFDGSSTCTTNLFCRSNTVNKTQVCLMNGQFCDGKKDCLDGHDEGDKCWADDTVDFSSNKKLSACDALTFAQKNVCGECRNTPDGPECACTGKADGKLKKGVNFMRLGSDENGKPICVFKKFCKHLGTCDQICKDLDHINNGTKAPYECKCKKGYYQNNDDMTKCLSNSAWYTYRLDEYGDIYRQIWNNPYEKTDYYKSWFHANEQKISRNQPINANSALRRVASQKHGHYDSRVKTFTSGYTFNGAHVEQSFYTVETAKDGFDVIYIQSVDNTTLWDLIITLPKVTIDSLCPGLAYLDYTYLYVGATRPGNEYAHAIYAVGLTGNAALMVDRLPRVNNKREIYFTRLMYPVSLMLSVQVRDSVYFVQGTELWKFSLKNSTDLTLLKTFGGQITSIELDNGLDKIWVVLDVKTIVLVDYDCRMTPLEMHYWPKPYEITSINVHEDKIMIADRELGVSVWNKFTGLEEPSAKQTRLVKSPTAPIITKILGWGTVNSQRQTSRNPDNYWYHPASIYYKTRRNSTKICPKNTFNIYEKTLAVNYSSCYCLGWNSESVKVVDMIEKTDYETAIPCGEPSCNDDVLSRYPLLRQSYVIDGVKSEGVNVARCEKNYMAYDLEQTNSTIASFEFECARIGDLNADTATYQLHIDGAFVTGKNWQPSYNRHKDLVTKARNDYYYSSSSETYQKYKRYKYLKGATHMQSFGAAFVGKYCESYNENQGYGYSEEMYFSSTSDCDKSDCAYYEGKCVELTTAVNNQLANFFYTQSSNLTYCACPKHRYGQECQYKGRYVKADSGTAVGKFDQRRNGKTAGITILILVIVTVVAAGIYFGFGWIKGFEYNPYMNNSSGNNGFSYQDLDDDKHALFPDNYGNNNKDNNDDAGSGKTNLTYSENANNEFKAKKMIDTQACMGFNLPSSWPSEPPKVEVPVAKQTPVESLIDVTSDETTGNVVSNPFFGNKAKPDDQMPIIDL